jgi:polyisoprenyl-teichoic acid--peptidoglycan teichoic acid transferase
VTIGVVLMTLSGVTLIGGKFLFTRFTGSVRQQNLLGEAAAGGRGQFAIDGPVNLLLVGIDERPDNPDGGARSDAIIIVHIPATRGQAFLISIPRDAYVDIPPFPATGYPGGQGKINSAFEHGLENNGGRAGGFRLLAMTIKQLTGISFNGGAIVDFGGFQSLVAALGGVDMCVDERVVSVHIGTDAEGRFHPPYANVDSTPVPVPGITPQVYEPGCQHLNAWQALDYVRQRELIADGDYGRQRHQQQFLQAVVRKASSSGVLANPIKLDAVLRTAGQALIFDGGGIPITDWVFLLDGIGADRVVMLRTNGGTYHTEQVNGQSVETLSDLSLRLLRDVRDDDAGTFVADHPDWVVTPGQR